MLVLSMFVYSSFNNMLDQFFSLIKKYDKQKLLWVSSISPKILSNLIKIIINVTNSPLYMGWWALFPHMGAAEESDV